ncbi:MAG: UDP-N-acetylmuramate--L-alanine ligase [Candidatus Liptonbacteria bacterium]
MSRKSSNIEHRTSSSPSGLPFSPNSKFLIPNSSHPHVHLIGIGGIGMSSLAQWFLAQKWLVSGSDSQKSVITQDLVKRGINVKIGHKKAHVSPRMGLIIRNQAIRRDNPELDRAQELKIRVFSYPEAVGELTRGYETIAVAGAHGKSTTSAILSLISAKAKLDPTVIVGTRLKEFGNSNFRAGKSKYLVLESDEYGRAFLNYGPTWGIITNIDREHLDIYKNLSDIKNTFLKYISGFRSGGGLVLNRDDANLYSLKSHILKIANRRNLKVIWYSLRDKEADKIRRVIQIPGRHNLSNALGAHILATRLLKVSEKDSSAAIESFRGTWRRMELAGKYGGAQVFDDYAHHPNEIMATLSAFREKYPEKKIVCVFQPHLSDRLTKLFKEFQDAFDDADETLILPIYKVEGREENKKHHTAQELASAIQKKQPHKPLFYLAKPENLYLALASFKPLNKRVIVMMGAGNISDLTQKIIKTTPPSAIRKGY